MKLSDAIRLGSMIRPQAFGLLFDGGGSCALGAAAEALGQIYNGDLMTHQAPLPDFAASEATAPCGCPQSTTGYTVRIIVTHLNDDHRWTREAIADWVATIEPQETPAATHEQHAEVLA